jgi:predicted DCC family thiol-disulfide oxidoreductase YuxK
MTTHHAKRPDAAADPAAVTSPGARRPRVFYDGGCPVCRREIAHYRGLDRTGRVHWHDIDAHPEVLADHGIDRIAAMRRFHVIDAGGEVRSGAEAFTVVWAELPGWRLLARLVRGLRLLGPLESAYEVWAQRRWRRLQRGRCAD